MHICHTLKLFDIEVFEDILIPALNSEIVTVYDKDELSYASY